jgi:hypothetical protein
MSLWGVQSDYSLYSIPINLGLVVRLSTAYTNRYLCGSIQFLIEAFVLP